MPKVSVIVTTYNRKEYLTETIQSILNQTYQDFELIIVDNYSNYNFFELIMNFKSAKIIPFQNHNNSIIAINRNFGIKQAIGEYIAFCDDDDIWLAEKLEVQINIFLKNQNCILVSTMAKAIGINSRFSGENFGIISLRQVLFSKLINYSNPVIFSSSMVNKSAIMQEGGFDESPNKIAVEDFDLWIRIAPKGNFILIKEILIYYRFQKSNTSKTNQNSYHFSKIFYHQKHTLFSKLNTVKFHKKGLIVLSSLIHSFFILYFDFKRKMRIRKKSKNVNVIYYKLSNSN